MIEDIFRKILENLSFFYKNKLVKEDKKIYIFIDKILKKIELKNNSLKKTHINFNKKIIDILKKRDLSKFLRNKFIQKIFFVHNRLFIFKELQYLKKNSDWFFFKELLIENDVGDPIKYFLYPKSSGNRINHVFHLSILKKNTNIKLKKINNVFEFGGGYGCMASIFSKINKKVFFKLFDTMPVNLLQYYYLKQNGLDVGFKKKNKFQLLNHQNFKFTNKIKKRSLFIANWSLSETKLKFREKFIKFLGKYDYSLIAFQENFEDINNLKYFKNVSKKFINTHRFKIIKNQYYKGNFFKKQNHYFMIGRKLN